MISIVYLIICVITGFLLCNLLIPSFNHMTDFTFGKSTLNLNHRMITWPVSFVVGTIVVTWGVYLSALSFSWSEQPLGYGNLVGLFFFLILDSILLYVFKKKKENEFMQIQKKKLTRSDKLFLILTGFLSIQLMWHTFFVSHQHLYVGDSVASDFSTHIGMARSFSIGNNFPTQYSHFAGADIRYHFMYQFLVGNLEYLGMRIDWAFNLVSAAGLLSTFSMLYTLAIRLSNKRLVGWLTGLFFAFRSSYTLLGFLSNVPKGMSVFDALSQNNEFISTTMNEEWGLWNLNVYCNQRHLSFTLTILLLCLHLMIPTVYESVPRLLKEWKMVQSTRGSFRFTECKQKIRILLQHCVIDSQNYKSQSLLQAIFIGFILGATSFFNGAVVIATLLILFVMAVISYYKVDYLIIAGVTMILSFLQTHLFIHGSAVKLKFEFGFLSEQKTFFSSVSYMMRLMGILPIVLMITLFLVKRSRKYLFFAFLAPLIFAFTISLTPDIAVNHKYIMMSLMLLSIYAAILIEKLVSVPKLSYRFMAVVLVVLLTATGVYDYVTLLKKDAPSKCIIFDLKDPLTEWIKENTDSKDLILSSYYSLNPVVLGGGMLYLGWPYYGWSAGYDTDYRSAMVKQMFEADNPKQLRALIEREGIRFIIVDYDCRTNPNYNVNEENIMQTYQRVYDEGNGEWSVHIYDTKQPIQSE